MNRFASFLGVDSDPDLVLHDKSDVLAKKFYSMFLNDREWYDKVKDEFDNKDNDRNKKANFYKDVRTAVLNNFKMDLSDFNESKIYEKNASIRTLKSYNNIDLNKCNIDKAFKSAVNMYDFIHSLGEEMMRHQ